MDIPRCEEMFKYWDKLPPVHMSMAAYVGWGQKAEATPSADIEALMGSLPLKEFNPNER